MSSGTRGRAGKYNKPSRGGGKKFSRNLAPLDADGNQVSMWADPRDTKAADSSEEDSEEESSEEDSSEEEEEEGEEMTREQRKAAAKAKKEAAIRKKNQQAAAPGDLPPSSEEDSDDGDMPANPNHSAKAQRQVKTDPSAPTGPSKGGQLTRREREAIEKQQAKERYEKLHAEGKTDEARADLARLALVRQRREEEASRKKAEKDEKEAAEKKRQEEADEREQKRRDAALGAGGPKKGKKKT